MGGNSGRELVGMVMETLGSASSPVSIDAKVANATSGADTWGTWGLMRTKSICQVGPKLPQRVGANRADVRHDEGDGTLE